MRVRKRGAGVSRKRSTLRRIARYPNRRLYDLGRSAYVTLGDIHELIMEGVRFEVIEHETGTDMTRSVMLQVLVEQEQKGRLRLTVKAIRNLIRSHSQSPAVRKAKGARRRKL